MFKFSFVLVSLFSVTAFSSDFRVGDAVLSDYGLRIEKGELLEITSGGLAKTTSTGGAYIDVGQLAKYESVDTYTSGNALTGTQTYRIGDKAFDDYGNVTSGGVSTWNLGEILDITKNGLVRTSNTLGAYIDIGRIDKYESVASYEVRGWTGSVEFRVGEEVISEFGFEHRPAVIEDISSNGLVRTSRINYYTEIKRLQKK